MRNRILQRLEDKKRQRYIGSSPIVTTDYYHTTIPFESHLDTTYERREEHEEDPGNPIYDRIYNAKSGGPRKYNMGGNSPSAGMTGLKSKLKGLGSLSHVDFSKLHESTDPVIPTPPNPNMLQSAKDSGFIGSGQNILQTLNPRKSGGRRYEAGGVDLPGGQMNPIPGSDAVEFIGQSHDQGGILLDNQTEVEDKETMDKVTMKDGGKHDYFFSHHLKEGGVPFAELHKQILADGGDQSEIDYLAAMQEEKAGRKNDKVQTAKLGGIMQYSNGGTFKAHSEKSQKIIELLRANGYDVPDASDLNNPDISINQKYRGKGYYSDEGVDLSSEANRKDFYERNKAMLHKIDSDGDGVMDIDSWDDFDPKVHTSHFQGQFNDEISTLFNNDPKLMKAFEDEGYTVDDLKQFGFYDSEGGADTGEDNAFGQYTWSRTNPLGKKTEPCPPPAGGCPEGQSWNQETCACEGGYTITEEDKTVTKKKKDWAGAALGLGSMIPAVMAFTEEPDYMDEPDLQSPGIVKAERVAKQHLDRVDFNDQIARNANDATAMNKFIETSGGGPANIANKMAAYAKKQAGDRDIKAQEAKANIAIANEEAVLDNKRKAYNSEAALNASKFNVTSQEAAQAANIRNKMYVDEFNRGADAATKDRKLNAMQYGINTLAQLHRDRLTSQASDNLASAVDGQRGALNRFFNRNSETTTEGSEETTTTETSSSTRKVPVPQKRGGYRKFKRLRKYGK